jgi:hypothetical protein
MYQCKVDLKWKNEYFWKLSHSQKYDKKKKKIKIT